MTPVMPNALSTIQIIGDNRSVEFMLTNMEATLNPISIRGFLQVAVDPWIRSRAKTRFANEGDDVSDRWFPLRKATQQFREAAGYGGAGPINVRTGELEEYITGTPGGVRLNGLGATLTSPGTPPKGDLREKVETAQAGKYFPLTPPRPVMGVNEADLTFVLAELSRFVVTGTHR